METKEFLSEMLTDHSAWQKSILDFRAELKFLKQDLSGIVSKHTPREVPAHAEHFQNQFILQSETLDIMRHDFKQYENLLEANIENSGKNDKESIIKMHTGHVERLKEFETFFKNLKTEFNTFSQKHLEPSL